MGERKPFYRRHARALAFAAALVVISGLVLGLFKEAQALEMRFTQAPGLLDEDAVFTLSMKIDQGQRVPLQGLEAILEKQLPGAQSKAGAPVVGRAECTLSPVPGYACPRDAPLSTTGQAGIAAIRFADATANDPDGPRLGYEDIYDQGPLAATTTGYGYSPQAGYGQPVGGATPFAAGSGYGYGVATQTLWLRFDLTVRACATGGLATGTYYLTVLAKTGLPLAIGDLSSPYATFAVACDDDAAAGGEGLSGQPIQAPEGALAAWRAILPPTQGGRNLAVTVPDPALVRVDLLLTRNLAATALDVTKWDPARPPVPLSRPPLDATMTLLDIALQPDDGAVPRATFHLRVGAGDVPSPDHAVLLRHVANAWIPDSRPQLTLVGTGAFEVAAEATCCGPVAIGFDVTPPNVTYAAPTQPVSGSFTVAPGVEDNVALTQVEFFVDGLLVARDAAAPYAAQVDTTQLGDGEHELRVVATDYVGWTASTTVAFHVENS